MNCQLCGVAVPELYITGTISEVRCCINCVVDLASLCIDYQEGAIERVRRCSDEIGRSNNDTQRARTIRRKHYGSRTGLKALATTH